jgi:outer membrane immunogenic protein
MRLGVCLIFLSLFGAVSQLAAQDLPAWEISAGYTFVRTNAPPGQCGCFSMNGGNGAIAYRFSDYFSVAADVAAVRSGNVDGSNQGLTLTSYQFGPRFAVPLHSRITPFGEVLVGGAHASGLSYGSNGISSNAFAATIGGGLDLNLTRRISLRLVEADYYVTRFPNGLNDHENNLRVSAGIVLHFGH